MTYYIWKGDTLIRKTRTLRAADKYLYGREDFIHDGRPFKITKVTRVRSPTRKSER